jgi:hypothetical protein
MVSLFNNLEVIAGTDGVHTFHHGDCVGADAEAHVIATVLGFETVVHPPKNEKLRAFCKGDLILEPRDYLARNHQIIDATDLLFAVPDGPETKRSGTWSTIRYARKVAEPNTTRVVILT